MINKKTLHLVVNNRLAASLQYQHLNQNQTITPQSEWLEEGESPYLFVTETLSAMTPSQWWQQWQYDAMLSGELSLQQLPEKVLSNFEAVWWFEKMLTQWLATPNAQLHEDSVFINDLHQQAETLMNISATAKLLYQARQMVLEYFPIDWHKNALLTAESQLFVAVNQQFDLLLQSKNWLDEASLANQRIEWYSAGVGAGQMPERVVLHGFNEYSPYLKALTDLWQQKGVDIVEADSASPEQQTSFSYAAQDKYDEVQQAVLWAVQQWQALDQQGRKSIKIAIVAPDLNEYKSLLVDCFDEQLFARQASQYQWAAGQTFYNLSLGEPLAQTAIVAQAIQTWQIFLYPNRACRFEDWSRWLLSPYAPGELAQRHLLDRQSRSLQTGSFLWPQWVKNLHAEGYALPEDWLEKMASLAQWQIPAQLDVSQLVEILMSCLDKVGWPGNRKLRSIDFQRKQAFEEALNQFAQFQSLGQMSLNHWLRLLQRFLNEKVHQPKTQGEPPIQMMGMLEAGGQSFDALWVLGLYDEQWPRPPSPNPFLPNALQRQLKVSLPRSEPRRELTYAVNMSKSLAHSSPLIVSSYPRMEEGAERLPSPLMSYFKAREHHQWVAQTYQDLSQSLRQYSPLRCSWHLDQQGAPVLDGAKVKGGTGILNAQQKCPLMAYIDYRLGAAFGLEEVDEQLMQNNQGILVHRVLELFWRQQETQTKLALMDDQARYEALSEKVDQAFNELQLGLNTNVLAMEQKRIIELCMQWLDLESKRPAGFKVEQFEQRAWITLAGIQFRVIVDRIDHLDNGRKVILDYKTGKASINDLIEVPMRAPQLAAYLFVLSDKDELEALGYGLLHSDDGVKLNILSQDADSFEKSRSMKVFSVESQKEDHAWYQTSWEEFLQALRQEVIDLAAAIKRGDAQMIFKDEKDVQFAKGYLALRLPEVRTQMQHSQMLQEILEGDA